MVVFAHIEILDLEKMKTCLFFFVVSVCQKKKKNFLFYWKFYRVVNPLYDYETRS